MSKLLFAFTIWSLIPSTGHAYTRRPFIIAVAGGSASGKTHNARLIVKALGEHRAALMSADNFYAPERQDPRFYVDGKINYDHPTAVNLEKLAWHISYLRSGFPTQVPRYTYGQAVDVVEIITHQPQEFIVVEGIYALYPEIAKLVDFRVYVDVPREIRLERRLKRDQEERGLAPDDIRAYFERVVEPMHGKYIQASALLADHIMHSPNDPVAAKEIVAKVLEQAELLRQVKAIVMLDTYARAMVEVRDARPLDFAITPIDDLHPSQEDLGYLALSQKSDLVDKIVRDTALDPVNDSQLRAYLEKNPIPVAMVDGILVMADHHHLLAALHAKGIRSVLTTSVAPETVDPARLAWVKRQPRPLRIGDLRNNPYRSLASLVRDLGIVRKTGRHHEEFEWANYYRERLREDHRLEVTEEMLLDVDQRQSVLDFAVAAARDQRAKDLPGYTGPECQSHLL